MDQFFHGALLDRVKLGLSKILFCIRIGVQSLRKTQGFTVLELLVAVAIVGILVNLSITNYNSKKAKAHQAEAKLALAAVFNLEKSFYSEYAAYIADFDAIGYTPEGYKRFYAIGWQATSNAGTIKGYSSAPGVSYYAPVNRPVNNACAIPCLVYNTQVGWCWPGLPLPASTDPQTFDVEAFGAIDKFHTCPQGDGWSIDQSRVLVHTDIAY